MASVKTITLPDGSSYDFKATYDIEGNNISETYINKNEKGAASGVAPLNSSGKIDDTYLPSSSSSGTSGFVSESGVLVTYNYEREGTPYSKLVANIKPVQNGSGDPSPSNVRAISGFSSVHINTTKNNLFNKDTATDGSYVRTTGVVSSSSTFCLTDWIGVNASSTFYYSGCNNQFGSAPATCFYDSDHNYLSGVRLTSVSGTISIPSGASYMRMSIAVLDKETAIVSANPISDYEQFGTTYTISFGDAGTVYAGTLDVLSGKLTVTHNFVDMGTLTWTRNSSYPIFQASLSDSVRGIKEELPDICCSIYSVALSGENSVIVSNNSDKTITLRAGASVFIVKDEDYTDASSFSSFMSGKQLVYELKTPQTYQLTPAQVTTLLGQNNVWCDAGDIDVEVIPNEIINYIKSNALVVSQDSSSGELTLS